MKEKAKEIKEYLIDLGFTLSPETVKPYGRYISGFMIHDRKILKSRISINVSVLNIEIYPYMIISDTHYSGHLRGYIEDLKEIKVILDFITRSRKIYNAK